MISSQSVLRLKRTQILQIAARNGVKRLRVFGSVARGTDDAQSDIDFLVELAPNRSLLDLGNFLYEVRSLLGKEVDVALLRRAYSVASATACWLRQLIYER
jgi:hypothetical protein